MSPVGVVLVCFVESTPNVYSFIKWRCAAVFRTPRALLALPSDQAIVQRLPFGKRVQIT
jgi:hypothetical protein